MAEININNIPTKTASLSDSDKLLGTDSDSSDASKNFLLEDINDYIVSKNITTGTTAPTTTPTKTGDIYIDTTNDISYIAIGTSGYEDWKSIDNFYTINDKSLNSDHKLVEDLQDFSVSETIWNKGSAGSQADDTTDYVIGYKSAKLTTDGDGVRMQSRKTTSSFSLTDKYIKVWVKVDDQSEVESMRLWVTSDSFSGYAYWELVETTQGDPFVRDDTWTEITLLQSEANTSGTVDWANINGVQLTLQDKGVTAVIGHFGGIASIDEHSEPIISFTFDDGHVSQYEEGLPYLSLKNYPATAYVISSYVDAENSSYMSLSQLKELQNLHRWDISAHGSYDLANDLTIAQAEREIRRMKEWLLNKGFYGGDHLALPNGGWNEEVKPYINKYFKSARTIFNGNRETINPADQRKLRVIYITNSTTVADIKSKIDDVITSNGWGILVFHKLVTTATTSTEYNIADFQEIVDYVETNSVTVKTISDIIEQ